MDFTGRTRCALEGWKTGMLFGMGKSRTVLIAVLKQKSRFSVDIISEVAELTEVFRGVNFQDKHLWMLQSLVNKGFRAVSPEVFRCLYCFGY